MSTPENTSKPQPHRHGRPTASGIYGDRLPKVQERLAALATGSGS